MLTLHDVQKIIKETSSMTTERFLSLDQFSVFINPPEMHRNILYASVYEDGRLCLNSRLAEKLSGKPVRVRFTEDAKHLCFEETNSKQTVTFPKNGSKKLPDAAGFLKKCRKPLPAKYEVHYSSEGHFWQGDYIESPFSPQSRKRNSLNKS